MPTISKPKLSRRGFLGGLGAATVAATALPGAVEQLTGVKTGAPAFAGTGGSTDRLDACRDYRLAMSDRMVAAGMPTQRPNGDEERFPDGIASFTKGLPHDSRGEVFPHAWSNFRTALSSGVSADLETVQLGGVRKLVNPLCGQAFDTEGNDPHQFVAPAPPRFDSAEAAGEMVELYWMALLRDIPFLEYHQHDLAHAAAAELSSLSDFRGPVAGGPVTIRTLFRDKVPGFRPGPYVSQFMWLPTPYGAEYIERRMRTLTAGSDHGTSFSDWLAIQDGNVPGVESHESVRRYVLTGRDLAQWVRMDVLFQAYFNACLILDTRPSTDPLSGGIGCPYGPGNPYRSSLTQEGFGTWGPPAFKALVGEIATRALKATWFQKWYVHRRMRPEEYGGRVHLATAGEASYSLHPDVLESEALARVQSQFGTGLLPLVYPEGSPIHPSYTAGHATVAGACVTVLKALFDESYVIPNPVVPTPDGQALVPWTGVDLTVGGELNKLASNVATGRNIGGVHWRSDALESLYLGEQIAIEVLRDHKASLVEEGSFTFTRFNQTQIEI